MWFDWKETPQVNLVELYELCPVGEYRVVSPESLPPNVLSSRLLEKTHRVLIVCSGTDAGRVYVMLNLNRIDRDKIDQMPYAIAIDGHGTLPSGVLVQHGDYHENRTNETRSEF